ncbi:thioredoxin-dependent thiol peroxidase [Rhizobium sp. L1K21]|nr:thioredoxin-dependent thiol peroxidase [Rhizobium sp. L1K21]
MSELNPGDKAPDFTLPRDGGGTVSLSDFSGKNVVLYFYPKDNTTGCTIEAVDFSGLADAFAKLDTVVIGMSPDTVKSHDNFVKKQNLSVILASDTEKSVLEAYGVWQEKSMYGRQYMGVARTTYLIGKDGVIRHTWTNVKAKGHAEAVLEEVKNQG